MPEVIQPLTPTPSDPPSDQPPESPMPPQIPQPHVEVTPSSGNIPSVSTTPAVSGPVVGFGDTTTPVSPSSSNGTATPPSGQSWPPSNRKKHLTIAGIALALILLLGGGYVFAFYLPNTPNRVYGTSLVNSGKALDQLIKYSEQQQQIAYKSASVVGSLSIKTGSSNTQVNVSGASDNKDTTGTVSSSFLGNSVTANFRSILASGADFPDTYFQVKTNPALLNQFGLGSLNGKWIGLSHTYVDSILKNLKQQQLNSTLPLAAEVKPPTQAQIDDATNKAQVVNKHYLFTADTSKAVLANKKFLGKTTLNGRTQDHYSVGYNKNNLAAYVTAMGSALDSSQLNTWTRATYKGKNISQVVDLSSLASSIKNSQGTYRFDLWADTKTKLVSKLAFGDPTNKSTVFYIGQNYTGGSSYPFSFGFTETQSGSTTTADVGLTVDTVTHKLMFNLTGGATGGTGTTLSGTFTITPSENVVHIVAPTGAEPLQSVLNSLGLGGLPATISGSNATPASASGSVCSNPSLYLACSPPSATTISSTKGVRLGAPLL